MSLGLWLASSKKLHLRISTRREIGPSTYQVVAYERLKATYNKKQHPNSSGGSGLRKVVIYKMFELW